MMNNSYSINRYYRNNELSDSFTSPDKNEIKILHLGYALIIFEMLGIQNLIIWNQS